jgi:thiosulfate/3-mercaptopyruvate sulfurtransferase
MCCLKAPTKEQKGVFNLKKEKGSDGNDDDNNHYINFHLPIICDVHTLQILIQKKTVRVVDVRKEEDYQQEHIPTAVSIPLAEILKKDNPQEIINILQNAGISDNMPVVIYDDTFGALAARVTWTFQYMGHTNTALLEMTFSHWKNLGLQTEKKINIFPRTEHALNVNHGIHADASYIETVKEQPNKILIDSRERLNFLTEHIPGAKNIPYTMLGSNGSIFRKAEDIKRFIENRGISADSEIITYCGSVGTLSGLAYYALKLPGVKNVKLYSQSFREWKSLGKPKEEFKDANYWDLSAE